MTSRITRGPAGATSTSGTTTVRGNDPAPPPPASVKTTHGHRTTDAVSDPVATKTTTTTATGATTKAATLSSLIDGAKDTLYLHLTDLHDKTLSDKLLKAQERGVDVHVLVTPGKTLDQQQVQTVLALTDSGVDVLVKKQSALADRVGVADGTAFSAKKPDPVAGDGAATVDTKPDDVKKQVAAFQAELASKVTTSGKGLLAPEKVVLHSMPESTSAPILNAINSSKKSIDLEVYQLADRDVVDALKNAAKRGVTVRIMVEPKSLEPSNYPNLSKELKAAGIQIQGTPPGFDTHGNVDHAKFMVVDDQEMLFGTGNLVRVGLGGNEQNEANTRDFWTEDSRKESVGEASQLFNADWNRQTTQGMKFTNLVVTPDDDVPDIDSVIDGAKKSVSVYNQSLSDKPMIQKLLAAKARGVDVKVLLGAYQDPGRPPANDPAVKQLKAAGIKVEYLTNSYLHAKAVVTEDTAFVGSQNFTGGGLVRNREVGEIFKDPSLVKSLTDTFNSDFANPGAQPG